MARRQRKPKKSAGLGYFIILFLILILFAVAAVFVSRRFAPSKTLADLDEYYNLSEYTTSNRAAAGSNELAIVIEDAILDSGDTDEFRAVKTDDGNVYIALSTAQKYIDSRFYADENEGYVILTTAADSVISAIGSSIYTEDGEDHDAGYEVARYIEGSVYLNMDFIADHSTVKYTVLTDPGRLFIQQESQTYNYCTADSSTKIRMYADKKSSIIADVEKGSKLKVVNQTDGWYKVLDAAGHIGYVQSNFMSEIASETITSDYTEPEYTHITLDEKINMVWHGIYYYDANYYLADYTYNMTGVNVLAPTWFLFADTEGTVSSYANQEYVDYAHQQGWQVWAVLEDLDGESSVDIVTYTSKRKSVISQIINECLTYGIDGINVDLEQITSDEGSDFIQFIRELSVECRKNNLILSVDDYAPYSYNSFRHTDEQSKIADYVAIMTYDDYVGTGTAGPNSSLSFVEEVLDLCKTTVDMDRLIVGLPFYSRVWYVYTDGTVNSETLDMNGVEELAANYGLTFEWQESNGYDYVEYDYNGGTARLWYENAKSLQAKMQLINQYGVAGVAGWRLGQETSDVWPVLAAVNDTTTPDSEETDTGDLSAEDNIQDEAEG